MQKDNPNNINLIIYDEEMKKEIRNQQDYKLVIEYANDLFEKRTRINKKRWSYGMKHDVEKYVDEYISNEALVIGMLDLGYKAEHIKNSPNYYFNMNIKKIAIGNKKMIIKVK